MRESHAACAFHAGTKAIIDCGLRNFSLGEGFDRARAICLAIVSLSTPLQVAAEQAPCRSSMRCGVGRSRYLMSDASYAGAIGQIRHSKLSTIKKAETAHGVSRVLIVRRAELKN
jgi:hypothetical protein